MRRLFLLLAACSAPAGPAANPVKSVDPVAVAPPADAASPDAGVAPEVEAAAPYTFRYHTVQRTETWTLKFANGAALLVVDGTTGTTRYQGTMSEELALDAASPNARMRLQCKRAQRKLSDRCNDAKAKPLEVLDCYHPDFATPMPFAQGHGVEYVVDATCTGYRLIP